MLTHELTHVRRRDALTGLLAGLGQLVYYPIPWLWSLCSQLRLCQEYLADAAAVATCDNAEDYAQFLLGWAGVPSPLPLVTGVAGRSSDLYRRITMLLKTPMAVERHCPRRRALLTGCGLLALAVLGSGIGRPLAAAPGPGSDKLVKEEPKKDERRTDASDKQQKKPTATALQGSLNGVNLQELLRLSGLSDEQFRALMGQLPEDNTLKELMEERERVLQDLQGLLGRSAGTPPGPALRSGSLRRPEGRLGVGVSAPGATLAEQLDLPKGQGLAIEEVRPDSAAAKVGLKAHDIILELAGKPVSSDLGDFQQQLAAIPANKPVEVLVLRRGRRETLKGLQLPESKTIRSGSGVGIGASRGLPGGAAGMGLGAGQGLGGGVIGAPGGGGFLAPGALLGGGQGLLSSGTFLPDGQIKPFLPGAAGQGVMTTTFRTDDRFTSRHEEGSLVITVTGKVADGQANVSEIQVQDGRDSHHYKSLDTVPEAYRDKAKRLVKAVEQDKVRIETKEYDGVRPQK